MADDNPQVAGQLRGFASNREAMADDLRSMAARYGDIVDSDGSAVAGLHRGWIGLKDALTGSGIDAVVKSAIKGEEHAITEFEKALDEKISADLRTKVESQLVSIRSTKTQLEGLTA